MIDDNQDMKRILFGLQAAGSASGGSTGGSNGVEVLKKRITGRFADNNSDPLNMSQ